MDDKTLRYLVKLQKIYNGIPYAAIADRLGIRRSSFYNWLKGQYDFGDERREQLADLLKTIQP